MTQLTHKERKELLEDLKEAGKTQAVTSSGNPAPEPCALCGAHPKVDHERGEAWVAHGDDRACILGHIQGYVTGWNRLCAILRRGLMLSGIDVPSMESDCVQENIRLKARDAFLRELVINTARERDELLYEQSWGAE